MKTTALKTLAATLVLCFATANAIAEDAQSAIQQVLEASMKDKRGVMLHVNGVSIGGGVVRIESGQWVELRSQEYGKIIVRLDRIDAAATR